MRHLPICYYIKYIFNYQLNHTYELTYLRCAETGGEVNAGKKEKDYLISLASQSDTIASFLYF